MRKVSSILLMILLVVFGGRVLRAQIPSFTESFSSSGNIDENNNRVTGGYLRSGYAYGYYPSDAYYYEWGNISFCTDSIYVVWADDREDGDYHVYLAKINSSDGSSAWTTNIRIDTSAGEFYRPSIYVKDKAHIYVTYARYYGGLWYLYAQRFIDNGTSAVPQWNSGSDLRLDDGSPGDGDMHWWVGDTEVTIGDGSDNSLYAASTWWWTGSGDRTWVYKVNEDGSGAWADYQIPYRSADGAYFYRATTLLSVDNYQYIFAYKWAWNSSTYKGDRGPILGKFTNTGTSLTYKGTHGMYIQKRDPWNLSYARYYVKYNVLLSTNRQYLYFVYNDYRDGTDDVWIQKMDINNTTELTNFIGNTGGGTWQNDVKVNHTATGDQRTPTAALNPFNSKIYVVYRDANQNRLELNVINPDGSLYNGSDISLGNSAAYHPRIVIDNQTNGIFYLAWLKSSGGRRYIEVAKYDQDGVQQWLNSNVVAVTYKTKSHTISKQLSFSPPALSVKKAMLTNFTATSNGYNIKVYFSHNGGDNWYAVTNNKSVAFDTTGWEFKYKIEYEGNGINYASIDKFTIKASKYYTGDLLYSTVSNTGYKGENVIEQLGSSQSTNEYVVANGTNKAIYYVRIKNTGNTNANFYVYGYSGNTYFDVKYYDENNNDITSTVTSWTGVLFTNLSSGSYKMIKVEITPTINSMEGQEFYDYLFSYVDRGVGLHDSIRLQCTAWKYRPDFLIKRNKQDNYIGDNLYETTTVVSQQISTNANSFLLNYEEKHTNYILLQNDGVWTDNMQISVSTNFSYGVSTNWYIYVTNETVGEKVSFPYNATIPAGETNLLKLIIYPKISVVTNDTMTLNFQVKSINTSPADDPLRLENGKITYQAFKKQPDLYISPTKYFLSRTGDGLYSWTNTVATQYLLQKTVPDRTISFYIRLNNDGESQDTIKFRVEPTGSSNWAFSYYLKEGINYNNKTYNFTNSNGTNFNMVPNEYYSMRLDFTPNTNVPSGEWLNIKVEAFSTNKAGIKDVVYVRPYNKKLRPDVLISSNTNSADYVGSLVYETNGATQRFYRRLYISDEEKTTNYIKVINKSPTEEDTITLQGIGSSVYTNWVIKYYNYTNMQDITTSITNSSGYDVTLQTNEEFKIMLVVNPKTVAVADETATIKFYAYSKEVDTQRDVVAFSNIAVDLQPDIIVAGLGDNDYNYVNQISGVDIVSGVTNTNSVVTVENDGGSVESYKLSSFISNYGGSITNWDIKFIDLSTGADITYDVTNNGYIFTNMVSGASRDVRVRIFSRWNGNSDTNSAVGNKIHVRLYATSVTKPSIEDIGAINGTIKRGIPDIFFKTNNLGVNYYTTNYNSTNTFNVQVHRGFPVKLLLKTKNTGIYQDDFLLKSIEVSNANWSAAYTNYSTGVDITSDITGAGHSVNNLSSYGSFWYYITFVATNGNVGDKVYFYENFDTQSVVVRKDRILLTAEIIGGNPDIAGTNFKQNIVSGYGQDATNEYFYDNIEDGETNVYILYLRNDIGGNTNDIFKFKQISKDTGIDIKYYTNNVEIPESDITNGLILRINCSSNIPIKVKINADSAVADSIGKVDWTLYLTNFVSAYDSFEIRTKKLDIQPDITVYDKTNNYGANIYTNEYEVSKGRIDILRGATNNDLWVRIQNDGESVENYRIISWWSNVGGEKTNWIVRYYDKSDLSDITSEITNSGKVYNLSYNAYKDIGVKIYAKDYGIYSTNSAVGNQVKVYFKFTSETRTNQYDTGSGEATIRKGIPDIFDMENNIGYGVVTNQFTSTNRVVVGVVLGYAKRYEYKYLNIGSQEDVFKNYIVVKSNANWSYGFTNVLTGNDITAQLTNTNQGYISTNNNVVWDYERIRLTLKADSGSVGDACYFYTYLDTESEHKRRDVLLIVGKIVDGLPDLACSNYQNYQVTGWGKEATNESAYDLIEENETNTYELRLHNDTTGGSNALFVFKSIRKSANVNLLYYTNNVQIPESDISNGIQLRIDSDSYVPMKIKFNANGVTPDDVVKSEWKLYLQEYPSVIDTFTISNKKVEFQPDLVVITNGGSSGENIYDTNSYYTEHGSVEVISGVTNEDLTIRIQNDGGSVEGYRLYSFWSNVGGAYSNWIVRFYDKLTMNDITSEVTNNGYLYDNLTPGQYKDVYVKIYPKYYGTGTTNSAVGNKLKVFFKVFSDTRNWHRDLGVANATIKRGIADVFFADNSKGKGFITNTYVLSNEYNKGYVKGYSGDVDFYFRNIGKYEDIFNLTLYVASNQGIWNVKVEDLNDSRDITGSVTNTNIGYSFTNTVNFSYNEKFRVTLTPTAGSIGDKIYLYGKVKTKTLEEREDVFWIVGEITEGLPDVACSNIGSGLLRGIGQTSSTESMFNLIEASNTNEYYIILRNEITGTQPSDFIFKESSRVSPTNATVLYYTNDVLIPYSKITQGITNSIAPQDYKRVKVKINLDDYKPDNKIILSYNFALKNSPTIDDTFTITNRKMEVIPDMVISYSNNDIGNNVYDTNDYLVESKTDIIYFSGVENTNIKVKLINRGGSQDTFKFYSWWSNIGGKKSDWDVFYNNSILDTYMITNDIYTINQGGDTTNIISISIKPKWFGTGVTNSAVGNGIKMYFRYSSESLSYHKDIGSIGGNIERGLSEIYLTNNGWSKANNFVTNEYVTENSTNIIFNPYDVKTVYIRLKNTGIYTDIYKYSIHLTYAATTPWIYSISNITKSEDVTAKVINTNTGIIITNGPGYMDTFKITVSATNGSLNDTIQFDNRLETLTLDKRSDRVRVKFSLKGGIPDIACTNVQSNTFIGWGREASVESTFNKIEENETNRYRLLLHNELGGTGSSEFVFKQSELRVATNISIRYFTNNVEVNYSDVSNGLHIYLPATNYKIVDVKVNGKNMDSGTGLFVKYRLNYVANTNLIDEFSITNLRVNPGAKISFTGTHTNYTNVFLRGIDLYYDYYVKIENKDVVPENLRVMAKPSDMYWRFKYYDCGTTTNEITGTISDTNNGWWTGTMTSGDSKIIHIEVWTLSNVYGGLTNTSWIKVSPLKNLSIETEFGVMLKVVGGIPDVFMSYKNQTIGSNTYNFTSINSFRDKIEAGETNIYPIYMQSLDPDSASTPLTIKEVNSYSNGIFTNNNSSFIIKYYDASGNDVTTAVRSTGLSLGNVASNSMTNIYFQIIPESNTLSSNLYGIKLKLFVTGASNKYDIISFTNIMVNPDVDLRVATVNDVYWLLQGYSDSPQSSPKEATTVANLGVSFYVALINKDKVEDDFVIVGDTGDANWAIKYYDDADNDITDEVINGVYTNYNVSSDSNSFSRIRCSVIPGKDVKLNESKLIHIYGYSAKNSTRLDNVYARININSFVMVGTVIDKKTKSPIKGATVTATDGLGRISEGTTDSEGRYRMYIYPVYNLKQTVKVEVAGYVGDESVIYVNSVTNEVNFELVSLNMSSDEVDVRIFPNPISVGSGGTFVYAVPEGGETTLELYDIYGRLLKVLFDGEKEKGVYYIKWDGKNDGGDIVPRGVYLFVVDTPKGNKTEKVFIK